MSYKVPAIVLAVNIIASSPIPDPDYAVIAKLYYYS